MKIFRTSLLVLFIFTLNLNAQFAPMESSFTSRDIGINLNNSGDIAGVLSSLRMQHSVSMSTGSSSFGNQSTIAYQNNFYMPLSQNIRILGSVSLVQPTFSTGLYSELPFMNQAQVYYDTQIQFDLGKNTKLQLGLSNKPVYHNYNYYSPYGAFNSWQISE